MKYLYRIFCVLLFCSIFSPLYAQQGNDVKFGIAQLEVDFRFPIDSVNVTLTFRNILTETERICNYSVAANEKDTLEIPVFLKQTVGYINVSSDSLSYFDGFVGLHQDVPLRLSLTAIDSVHTEHVMEGGMGFNGNDAGNLVRSFVKFMESRSVAPKDRYLDWHNYIGMEMDSLYAQRVGNALKNYALSTKARTWLTNVMTAYYLGGRIMSYQQDAQQYYQLSVPAPPLDYYKFLKRFDFSRIMMHSDSWGLIVFLRFFLHAPVFDIPEIGDTNIANWMADIKGHLTGTVGEMPKYFLELLSALSYIQQLQKAEPFSAIQVANIQVYYKNDIGKYLLQENAQLVKVLNHKRESRILTCDTDSKKTVMKQILQRYEGKPVVVEFWNTWCGPCMQAHKMVEPIKAQAEFLDVEFVYIADDSSTKGMWEGTVPNILGDHYILTEKEAKKIRKEFGCTGFPFFLFYNAKHELMGKRLGFPGPIDFRHRLRELR